MGDGPPGFPLGFTCPVVLGNAARKSLAFRLRGFHPLWLNFPEASARRMISDFPGRPQSALAAPHNPPKTTLAGLTPSRFGLFRVRSPLLTESRLLSLPQGTEMVHFPWLASMELCVHSRMAGHDPCRVSPFGNPRIKASLRLPEAYRSLPRPSSPSDAKASPVCPL